MSGSSPIELRAQPHASASRSDCKPIPTRFTCAPNLQFAYSGSPDGVDTNLLIFLHGRGDSETPFAKLGNTLRLPQTATLAFRGPRIVPLLDEHEREWWNETDMMGMHVLNQDPSPAIKMLCEVLVELQQAPFGWSANSIHLFGFGQGGTLACEAALAIGKAGKSHMELRSVVSVQGPLLSLPMASVKGVSTKILYVHRAKTGVTKTKAEVTALQRAFLSVQVLPLVQKAGATTAMPESKAEWAGIMTFWSEHLQSSSMWQRQGEVFEVTGGHEHMSMPEKTLSATVGKSTDATAAIPPDTAGNAEGAPDGTGKTANKALAGFKRGFLSRGL